MTPGTSLANEDLEHGLSLLEDGRSEREDFWDAPAVDLISRAWSPRSGAPLLGRWRNTLGKTGPRLPKVRRNQARARRFSRRRPRCR